MSRVLPSLAPEGKEMEGYSIDGGHSMLKTSESTIDPRLANDGPLRGIALHSASNTSEPMAYLLAHTVPEARYDSEAVISLVPRLHHGTREHVLKALNAWIMAPKNDDTINHPLAWFFGESGTGKTCIQRELASRCAQDHRLLASFFFPSHSPFQSKADMITRFIATLASQIASNIPGLSGYMSSAIQDDPGLLGIGRSAEDQVEGLIFGPLERFLRYSKHRHWWKRLKASLRGRWPEKLQQCIAFKELHAQWWNCSIIVVDGLDECVGDDEQQRIIRLMEWASMHPKFPLRFITSSRQEDSNIRKAFQAIRKVCRAIGLETFDANEDIAAYLLDGFARIRKSHPMAAAIEWPSEGEDAWPSRKVVDLFVVKAFNNFFYVSIIIKIAENPRRSPVESLDRIMTSIPEQNTADRNQPFAELDALHWAILHQSEADLLLVRKVLHAILFSTRPFRSIQELDEYLGLIPGSINSTIELIRPLISIPSPGSASYPRYIGFYHHYTRGYLLSKERSGDLFQNPNLEIEGGTPERISQRRV